MKQRILIIFFLIGYVESGFAQGHAILDAFQTKLWDKKKMFLTHSGLIYSSALSDSLRIVDSLFDFSKILKTVDGEMNALKSSFRLSLAGNNTTAQEIYGLNSGFNLKSGSYPNEFEFDLNLSVQSLNGNIQENFSVLNVSFDRAFKIDNESIDGEFFGFISRTSDVLMDVQSRYEVGGGTLINVWGKSSSSTESQFLNKLIETKKKLESDSIFLDSNKLKYSGLAHGVLIDGIDSEFAGKLENVRRDLIEASKRKLAPFRFALLFGVFYELERIQTSESFDDVPDSLDASFINSFLATSKIRWEVRPTIDIHFNENLKLSADAYWKLAIPGELRKTVYNNASESILDFQTRTDLRFEMPIRLSYRMNKNLTMVLFYQKFKDNAPNSKWIDGLDLAIVAANERDFFSLDVQYTF